MSDKSAIEWTDATWNPVTGCSKVSPGCAHCYAETLALTRLRGRDGYPGLPWTPENAAANVVLRPERLDQPLRWRRPRRIFVNSLSDLFHEQVPDAFIDRVFAVMAMCDGIRSNGRRHTFQVLTKRPERMRAYLTDPETPWRIHSSVVKLNVGYYPPIREPNAQGYRGLDTGQWEIPLPNVWLGVSVENQRWADERIPHLLATPAAVRFLSCEPLLGPLDLAGVRHLGWVIVGGESGPGHRPVDPAWVRSIRDQCGAAGVPFLFKQWGGRTPKSGGREIDGRTWDEYPRVVPR